MALTPMEPRDFRHKLSDIDPKPVETVTIPNEEQVKTLENKTINNNFDLLQRVNDLDRKFATLEKTVVDNGVNIVEKISSLEGFRIQLPERLNELSLLIKGINPPKSTEQPPTFQICTPITSQSPPGIGREPTDSKNPFAIGGSETTPQRSGGPGMWYRRS